MSCAGTPSWNRGRGQGGPPRGRRHLDRIRFGAASLTVVFVDGGRAALDCRVTVTPAAEVTWYVDTSFTVRSLRAGAGTDYYFRVLAENGAGASQPLTLDRSFVPRTPGDVTQSKVTPQTTVYTAGNLAVRTDYQFRVGAENVEEAGPPLTLAATGVTVTIRIRPEEGSPSRSPPPSTS